MDLNLEQEIDNYFNTTLSVKSKLIYEYSTSSPLDSESYKIHLSFEENKENIPDFSKSHLNPHINNSENYIKLVNINL